jgi:glyoxylase-like metal-dependent hydrolase (beta-lactamase superfamily II)
MQPNDRRFHRSVLVLSLALLALGRLPAAAAQGAAPARLQLEEVIADSQNFHVASTLILGPTEVVLFDTQNRRSAGRRVADRIAASGRRLTAIFISHPDEDHFFGALAIIERFPGTPIYMTPAAIAEFQRTAEGMRAQGKQGLGAEVPDSLFHPQPYPAGGLTVDGQALELIPDQQGDVLNPTNSAIWIPSLRAVLAGDIVFNGVYPYLAASTPASRVAWQGSLDRLAALHPEIVVAGHKTSADLPDTPASIDFMRHYLRDFDAERAAASDVKSMVAAIRAKYPDLTVVMLLYYSAFKTFKQ